jgi:hypothetical protein
MGLHAGAPAITETDRIHLSYLACRIRQWAPIWQRYIGSSFHAGAPAGLLLDVRSAYPLALIIVAIGPMSVHPDTFDLQKQYVLNVVAAAQVQDIGMLAWMETVWQTDGQNVTNGWALDPLLSRSYLMSKLFHVDP